MTTRRCNITLSALECRCGTIFLSFTCRVSFKIGRKEKRKPANQKKEFLLFKKENPDNCRSTHVLFSDGFLPTGWREKICKQIFDQPSNFPAFVPSALPVLSSCAAKLITISSIFCTFLIQQLTRQSDRFY